MIDEHLPSFPEIGSLWQHKNGNHYVVEAISNVETLRQGEYPTTVVYRNTANGKLYSRALARWHASMTLIAPAGDVIDIDEIDWKAIREAAEQSTWMPPEYMRNDWVSDVCSFLIEGPPTLPPKREGLPQRRQSETFDFTHVNQSWQSFSYKATVGYYMDGRPGEVFLSAAKITTDMDIAARDAAILLSFALQHGAKADDLRSAMTRDPEGRPLGVIGTLLDIVCLENQLDKE